MPESPDACPEDYEALEMVVEKLSSEIDDLRVKKHQKKAQLNLQFNKYELMKAELEMFLLEQEDKKNLDFSVLPTTLYTKESEKVSLLEERRRLEEDLTKSMLNDRRKRATKEDLRLLKKQFKETVAFYEVYGFKKSKGSEYLIQQEEKWKRLLLEYSNLTNKSLELMKAVKADTFNVEDKDELDLVNSKVGLRLTQLSAIEKRIMSGKEALDDDNQELNRMFSDLNINLEDKLDKGYSMKIADVVKLAQGDKAEKRKVALAYVSYKMYHDPSYIQTEEFSELYETLYKKSQATIQAIINEYENDKERIEACYQEFMMASSILCSLTGLEKYAETYFDREENSKHVTEFFQYLNANDNAVITDNQAKTRRSLADLHGHIICLLEIILPRAQVRLSCCSRRRCQVDLDSVHEQTRV